MEAGSYVPVTKSQVLALASLDEHHFGTEEKLLHDVYEQPSIHLRVGEAPGQPAAVLNQLVTTGDAFSVQVQDGNAQGGAGGLMGEGREKKPVNSETRALFKCSYRAGNHYKRKLDTPQQTNRTATFQMLKVPLLEFRLLGFVTLWEDDSMSMVPTSSFCLLVCFSDTVSL